MKFTVNRSCRMTMMMKILLLHLKRPSVIWMMRQLCRRRKS
nr:hypothetical protein Iba_chr10dCG2410 [Ipomoea batatas]